MAMNLFTTIRQAAALVADRASWVTIDHDRLAAYADSLPLDAARNPSLDPERHFAGTPEQTLAFVLCLDCLNFGSGWFPTLDKRPGCSGYFTMAWSLADWFRAQGVPGPERLAGLVPADLAAIMGQEPANSSAMELMGLFAQALNHLGQLLLDECQGSYPALVEAAGQSAARLVELLARMPFFRDVAEYQGLAVPFYKRAQITAADLNLALEGQGWGRFIDLDQLTIFADNLVPHVLRLDGVLRYDPDLADDIDQGRRLAPGSPQEVEIRASALHAVEMMVAHLRRQGQAINAHQLDYLLWNQGQGAHYKQSKPRHRARSVYY